MIKRDKIFYSACVIFGLGVVLAVMGYDLAIIFIVGAYLLRPTLHVFGLAEKIEDERQKQIHSRAGNVAFIAVMLTVVGIALQRISEGKFADEMYLILGIGIAVRAMVGLLMHGALRRAGSLIIMAIGIITALFGVASAGISMPSLIIGGIGLAFASLGLIAKKFPRIVSAAVVLIAAVIIIQFELYDLTKTNQALQMAVIAMLIAAACIFLSGRLEKDSSGKKNRFTKVVVFAAGTAVVLYILLYLGIKAANPVILNTSGEKVAGIAEIQGISCRAPISYHPNGKLSSCVLAAEDTLSGQPLPEGTVVNFTSDGVFDWCFLQQDTEIQGYLCRGEGHGFMTCFYPNGKLRLAWLAEDETIDNIPCAKYSFFSNSGTYFHENGRLKSCKLSDDVTIEGQIFNKGDKVEFDQDGKLAASSK